MCANRLPDNTYQINARGCGRDHYCTAAGTYIWVLEGTTTSTYHCLRDFDLPSTSTTVEWSTAVCPSKLIDRDFRNGQTVVICDSNTDCALRDGTYTQCQCVFRSDGHGVCTPDISNQYIFADYWNDCGSSNTISNQNEYNYWTQYFSLYTILQSGIGCLSTFKEVSDFQAFNYNSAGVLTAAAWVLLG